MAVKPRCPKCGSSNFKEVPDRYEAVGDYVFKCEDCNHSADDSELDEETRWELDNQARNRAPK